MKKLLWIILIATILALIKYGLNYDLDFTYITHERSSIQAEYMKLPRDNLQGYPYCSDFIRLSKKCDVLTAQIEKYKSEVSDEYLPLLISMDKGVKSLSSAIEYSTKACETNDANAREVHQLLANVALVECGKHDREVLDQIGILKQKLGEEK
jgi:hypothetical protein